MAKNTTISPNQLGSQVQTIVQQYTDDLIKKMPDLVKEVAQDTVKDLKQRASGLFGGTTYKRSFKSKKLVTSDSSKTEYTVYSTQPSLAHLLEKGHVIKNQTGQTYGMTKARAHWAPAEENASDSLERKIRETIEGGV